MFKPETKSELSPGVLEKEISALKRFVDRYDLELLRDGEAKSLNKKIHVVRLSSDLYLANVYEPFSDNLYKSSIVSLSSTIL